MVLLYSKVASYNICMLLSNESVSFEIIDLSILWIRCQWLDSSSLFPGELAMAFLIMYNASYIGIMIPIIFS